MTSAQLLITSIYSAFNQRNIEAALAMMTESVSWPRASEGGRVTGKEEVRAYWIRQWKQFDPHVQPVEVIEPAADNIHVRVHQRVLSLAGDVLSDTEVWHRFIIADGLIDRMDLEADGDSSQSPSSAFSHSRP